MKRNLLFLLLGLLTFGFWQTSNAQKPTLIYQQSFTASGAGTSGIPTVNLNLPAGKNRYLLVSIYTERYHNPLQSNFAYGPDGSTEEDFLAPNTVHLQGVYATGFTRDYFSYFRDGFPNDVLFSTCHGIFSWRDTNIPVGTTSITFPTLNIPESNEDEMIVIVTLWENVNQTLPTSLNHENNRIRTPTSTSVDFMTTNFSQVTDIPTGNIASDIVYYSSNFLSRSQIISVSSGWTTSSTLQRLVNNGSLSTSGWPTWADYLRDNSVEQSGISATVAYRSYNAGQSPSLTLTKSNTGLFLRASSRITTLYPLAKYSVSGTVFNDPNAANVNNSTGVATNAVPSGMYANLVDSLDGKVLAVVAVGTNGTYSFSSVPEGTYTVVLSMTQGTVGQDPPAPSTPNGWVNTGEFNGASDGGNTAPIDGRSVNFNVSGANVTNINFGIQQPPTAVTNTLASQVNPGGTTNVTIASANFDGNDLSGGTVTSIRITAFPTNATSITINGVQYTSTTFPVGGVSVPTNAAGNPTQAIAIDPIDGAITSVITYNATDNGGATSANATVSVPFTTVSISGNVFNDPTAGTVNNSTGTANKVPSGMFATLVNSSGLVVASVAVDTSGVFSIPGASGGVHTVILSTTQGIAGNTPPLPSTPIGWINTGEFNGASAGGNTAPVDGISASFTVATTNVINRNFAIQQPPVATNDQSLNNTSGATVTVNVLSNDSDPSTGGAIVASTVSMVVPVGATNVITDGNGDVTSMTIPGEGVWTVNNTTGAITFTPQLGFFGNPTVIQYNVADNGVARSNNATVTITYTPRVTLSGNVFNDINSNTIIEGGEGSIDVGVPLTMYLVDGSGLIIDSARVASDGSYALDALPNATYTIQLSSTQYAIGTSPSINTFLPVGFSNTGENGSGDNTGPGDGTPNGILTVEVTTQDKVNQNFGIVTVNQCSFVSNGDFSSGSTGWTLGTGWSIVSGAAQFGSDNVTNRILAQSLFTIPNDTLILRLNLGALNFGSNVSTLEIRVGGITYATITNPAASAVLTASASNGATINGFSLTAGTGVYNTDDFSISIPYTGSPLTNLEFSFTGCCDDFRVDNVVLVARCPISITGTVFNDINANVFLDGAESGINAGTTFYAYLVEGGVIVDSSIVASNGTYELLGDIIAITQSIYHKRSTH